MSCAPNCADWPGAAKSWSACPGERDRPGWQGQGLTAGTGRTAGDPADGYRWKCSERPRLAVAGLALPGRPGADQPAGVAARLQPVAEALAGDGLEQPDVRLEPRQQRLPLGPGE